MRGDESLNAFGLVRIFPLFDIHPFKHASIQQQAFCLG